jgi:hypothetical protein
MVSTWKGWRLSDFKQNDSSWIRHDHNSKINYVYINIPKNASSWMKNNFGGYAYNFRTNQIDSNMPSTDPDIQAILQSPEPTTYVIVLRDPITRWLSGAAQAFFTCPPTRTDFFMNWSNELIFDTVAFDEHTAPQTMFLKDVDFSQVVWFDCTDNLTDQIVEWAQDKFPIQIKPASDYKENVYKISRLDKPQQLATDPDNWTPMQCIHALKDRLYSKPEHVDKLKHFYQLDYALRESIKFYS